MSFLYTASNVLIIAAFFPSSSRLHNFRVEKSLHTVNIKRSLSFYNQDQIFQVLPQIFPFNC